MNCWLKTVRLKIKVIGFFVQKNLPICASQQKGRKIVFTSIAFINLAFTKEANLFSLFFKLYLTYLLTNQYIINHQRPL